ncbi:MAG: NADH-quinone oxidoreductase subunit NuoG [Pseudomonadota bacterium]|nr:NADH-quinone oxidoreductase subunit NuoG [Pseudomonadota bacterium]
MATIIIDTQEVEAEDGSMIIQAADSAGIYIPRFCYHEKLSIAANCRMCLVEVEKAPKPLPACATPVTDGMVVHTASPQAVEAQKGTLEFLLINHPLDCPICDQGGECPLQDQALEFGGDVSRFTEGKRVVSDPDIGPLIETEMTRCIHCTRCVRFGQEVAGIMELGAIGRGEDMKIATFIGETVDSEVSGNVIDLCPVGALTSKPYRFTARVWELASHDSVSPHDCLGSNLNIQTANDTVKRVLPRSNDLVNECWLSDRDRFSYEGVNSADRLLSPLRRVGDQFEEIGWQLALDEAAAALNKIRHSDGPAAVGALASPTATLEEFYLLQSLMRGFGSSNVDHRLRQYDFRDDPFASLFPGTEITLEQLDNAAGALLVGCHLRKELPLMALRLRRLYRSGGKVAALNPLAFEQNFPLNESLAIRPGELPAALARIAIHRVGSAQVPSELKQWAESIPDQEAFSRTAAILDDAKGECVLILGQFAAQHRDSSVLRMIASWLAEQTGIRLAFLPSANSAAAWLAGCVPHRGVNGEAVPLPGYHVNRMLEGTLKSLILFGLEPDLDVAQSDALAMSMVEADFVVSFSAFRSAVPEQANVVFPLAPFTETAGTYVNCDGRIQQVEAAMSPRALARPGWKILRVLANVLGIEGFDYNSIEEVRHAVDLSVPAVSCRLAKNWQLPMPAANRDSDQGEYFERIAEVPIYQVDPIVRRAPSLQSTLDNPPVAAHISTTDLNSLGLSSGSSVHVAIDAAEVSLPIAVDDRVPQGCVCIPTAAAATAALGAADRVRLKTGS